MSDVSVKVMMDLIWGSMTGSSAAKRELDDIVTDAVASGTGKGVKKGAKAFKDELAGPFEKLMSVGMRRAGDELTKAYKKSGRDQMKTTMEIVAIQRKLDKTQDEGSKKRLIHEKGVKQKLLKQEVVAQKRLIAKASSKAKEILDMRAAHQTRQMRSMDEKVQSQGENFQGLVQGAFSMDNIDAKGLVQGLSSALAGGLKFRAEKAAGTKGGGASAARLAGMASSVAAVAAPLAAIAGLLAAAHGQTKDLNKSLLSTATSADILGDSTSAITLGGQEYDALNVRLKMLRGVTQDLAYDFRMTQEEVSSYIGALNDAGLTVSEFRGLVRGSTSDMEAYRDVTRTAIMASQGLGISASEAAGMMNTMSRDLGGGLDEIQGAFGMIHGEAKKAGMTTKDFFAAINTASSGMALYNFRVGDTVGLFTDLVEILGEDMAKEQIGLQGTFKNMGTEDRVKATMTGGAGIRAAVAGDAAKQGEDFAAKLAEKGLKIEGLSDGDGLDMDKLAKMSDKSFREIETKLRKDDKSGAMSRQLRGVRAVAKGGPGALGHLSKTGETSAQLSQVYGMTGGKTLSETADSTTGRMLIEQLTGLQGEALDAQIAVEQGLLAKFESTGGTYGEDFFKAVGSGELFDPTSDEEAATQFSMMERAAQEQLMETRSMSQTMSNVIAHWLENIWLGVEHLAKLFTASTWFSGDKDELTARSESFKTEASQGKIMEDLGGEISAKESKKLELGNSEKDTKKKQDIQKEIDALKEQVAQARSGADVEKNFRKQLLSGKGVGEARAAATSERFGEGASAGLSAEALRAAGLGDLVQTKSVASGRQVLDPDGGTDKRTMVPEMVEKDVGVDLSAAAMANLDPEQATALNKLLVAAELKAEADKEAAEKAAAVKAADDKERKDQAEAQIKENKEGFESTVKTIQQLDQKGQTAEMVAMLKARGMGEDEALEAIQAAQKGDSSAIQAALGAGKGASIKEAATAYGMGIRGVRTSRAMGQEGSDITKTTPERDFIYRGDGTSGSITGINSRDDFFGAMPGGAIDMALKGIAGEKGKAGPGGIANINIYGDEARIYSIVKRVLKDSGYGDVKRY